MSRVSRRRTRGGAILALVATGGMACRNNVASSGDSVPDAAVVGCVGTGLLAGRGSGDTCRMSAELAPMDFGLNSLSYVGALLPCPGLDPTDPGGFSVEATVENAYVLHEVGLTTIVHAARQEGSQSCGFSLEFTHPALAVAGLHSGDSISISQRRTQVSDDDVRSISVIRSSSSQRVLFASVTGARPGFFDSDLLDMALVLDTGVLCQWPYGGTMRRAHFLTTSGDCGVDALTARCCLFWGEPYQVSVQSAGVGIAGQPLPFMKFELRAPGFALPAG